MFENENALVALSPKLERCKSATTDSASPFFGRRELPPTCYETDQAVRHNGSSRRKLFVRVRRLLAAWSIQCRLLISREHPMSEFIRRDPPRIHGRAIAALDKPS
jgi:hypothetical protein